MIKSSTFNLLNGFIKKISIPIFSLIFTMTFLCAGSNAFGQVPSLDWAVNFGGGGFDSGLHTDVDDSGNVYSVGWFSAKGNFASSTTNPIVLTPYGGRDVFVTKQDAQGNTLWAKNMGGVQTDYGISIVADENGNSYITGYFQNTAVFGIDTLTTFGPVGTGAGGDRDVFVTKLNTNGGFEWTKHFGGTRQDRGQSITIDNFGHIYVAGYFSSSTASFGSITLNKKTINNNGTTYDIFVTKIDTSGTVIWAENFGGDNKNSSGLRSITSDNDGNIYITGYVNSGTLFMSSFTLLSGGYTSKLDSSGNVIWAKSMGVGGRTIAVDNFGYVYTTGAYRGTVNFGPFSLTTTVTGQNTQPYLIKQDTSGNFIWAKDVSGGNTPNGNISTPIHNNDHVIAVDKSGNIYRTGRFSGTIDFDPGAGIYNLTANGTKADLFINVLDSSGAFIWAEGFSCPSGALGLGINIDNKGGIYTTGYFSGTAEFDPGPGTHKLGSHGSGDAFIQKLVDCSLYSAEVSSLSKTVCEGDTLNLTASYGDKYEWKGPNSYQSKGADLSIGNIDTSATGTYQVIASAGQCTDTLLVNVKVNPKPTISVQSNSPLCLDNTLKLEANGGKTYTWKGPANFSSNNKDTVIAKAGLANAGKYTVYATDSNGCSDSASTDVVVNPLPTASASYNGPVCLEETIKLSVSTDGTSYQWFGPNSFTSSDQNPSIPNADESNAGRYIVKVSDSIGCNNLDTIDVQLKDPSECAHKLIVPNVFTPNGDGKNDVFKIAYLDLHPNTKVVIFNRWGRVVYENDDYRNDWDGDDLADGSYFYIVTTQDKDDESTVLKGNVTILNSGN